MPFCSILILQNMKINFRAFAFYFCYGLQSNMKDAYLLISIFACFYVYFHWVLLRSNWTVGWVECDGLALQYKEFHNVIPNIFEGICLDYWIFLSTKGSYLPRRDIGRKWLQFSNNIPAAASVVGPWLFMMCSLSAPLVHQGTVKCVQLESAGWTYSLLAELWCRAREDQPDTTITI